MRGAAAFKGTFGCHSSRPPPLLAVLSAIQTVNWLINEGGKLAGVLTNLVDAVDAAAQAVLSGARQPDPRQAK